jgi:DNA-binding transcriptional LysR family regulator
MIHSILEWIEIPVDRLDAIRIFVRLVECGSFSAVGREEGIGQPAVSKHIASLERYLGAQLVLRTSRRIVITEAGQTFYESAKRLVDDFEAAATTVGDRQHAPRGLVRINVAPVHGRLCIMPLLAGFLEQYPDVSVEVSVSAQSVDLLAEGVDVAIRHGQLADSSLTARRLSSTKMVLAASTDYLRAHGAPARFTDLDAHACIVFLKGRERSPWQLKIGRELVSYMPSGKFLTGDAEAIRASVLGGMGISQVPAWLLEDQVRAGHVQVLLPQLQPPPLPIHLVYAAGRRVPMRVKVLMDYLVAMYRHTQL